MSISGDAGFLLDTNVISEPSRPRPDARVIAWLAGADENRVFLSVATLAEISRGVDRLPAGKRRRQLEVWLANDLVMRFDGRILGVDAAIGLLWGRVVARAEQAGHQIEAIDALLAATAERHELTLVTRNIADFATTGVQLVDPWQAATP